MVSQDHSSLVYSPLSAVKTSHLRDATGSTLYLLGLKQQRFVGLTYFSKPRSSPPYQLGPLSSKHFIPNAWTSSDKDCVIFGQGPSVYFFPLCEAPYDTYQNTSVVACACISSQRQYLRCESLPSATLVRALESNQDHRWTPSVNSQLWLTAQPPSSDNVRPYVGP